jgi:hypothetical protein
MVPLSTDAGQAEKWLKTQPNPLETFTQYDYEFIKKKLEAYLAPEGETEDPLAASVKSAETVHAKTPTPAPTAEPTFKLETQPKAAATGFDSLFDD